MSKESTADIEMSLEAATLPDQAIFESRLKQLTELGDKKISEEQILLRSAGRRDVAVAMKLLQKGKDTETRNNSGWIPLLIEVMQRQTPMVKLLLEYGAEPDVKCDLGLRTPLHQAAEAGYEDITE